MPQAAGHLLRIRSLDFAVALLWSDVVDSRGDRKYPPVDLGAPRQSLLAAQSENWFESSEVDDYLDDDLNRSM